MAVDTHTHSTASDSTVTPRELVEEAERIGLAGIALTDHDTVAGWEEAAAAAGSCGVVLIRGMELSTKWEGITCHILGYLFDPSDHAIQEHIVTTRASRLTRIRAIVDKLSADVPITWDDVVAHTPPGATVGRPHIADALVAAGVVPTRSAAFTHYLSVHGPYYVSHYVPQACEAIRMVTAAGGKAVLAHPVAPARNKVVPERAFDEMAAAGLFGVELRHPENAPELVPGLERIAARLQLRGFGASDYHGSGKTNRLGQYTTSAEIIAELVDGSALPVLG